MKIYSVTEFNQALDQILREMRVFVQGEVSGLSIKQKKWVTFELKDKSARMSCFLTTFQMNTQIEDGMEVKVFGAPGLYVPYGKFTFRVQSIEPMGGGALAKAFELTKKKLESEGVFDEKYKKPIPKFPERIGLITSEESAAYSDFVRIVNNRWSGVEIILRPVLVQGSDAPGEVISAIEFFNKRFPADVLVITRGGGSLEDLQAFNSENVCRAIFASKIPTICGIGHERDVTLAELVSDMRASTPTNAAERAVPDQREVKSELESFVHRLHQCLYASLSEKNHTVQNAMLAFQHWFSDWRSSFQQTEKDFFLSAKHFENQILEFRGKMISLTKHCHESVPRMAKTMQEVLENRKKLLETLNPLLVLKRGYSVVYNAKGKPMHSIRQIRPMERITTRFYDGNAVSWVEEVKKL